MPDGTNVLNGSPSNIFNLITAAGALGTAAYGLVDACKAFDGGISNAGFRQIRKAVTPLIGSDGSATPFHFGRQDMLATLRANWLNGVSKADQKATAKSLIRLSVTPENAQRLADETGVDGTTMKRIADKIRTNEPLLESEISVLGRFDAVLSAILDEAYERADQQYRNACKLAGALVAILLAVAGGAVVYVENTDGSASGYLGTGAFWFALLIGLISTPLAPVAKDLSSALATAAKAVSITKR